MTRPASKLEEAKTLPERPPDVSSTMDMLVPLELLEMAPREPERTSTLETMSSIPIERRPFLVAMSGPREGAMFALPTTGSIVVGRGSSCDLVVDDESVSRMHARISLTSAGSYLLEDLTSRNGTFVGNTRISKKMLVIDDLVRLGSATSLRFCLLDAVEQEFQRRLATAAIRDPLTGVFNRRQFEERLAVEVGLAKRHDRPLSLVLFDVDDFKKINDGHGHPVGDEVLRAVAAALSGKGRREDEVFRYGGEEFAVLARETPRAGAMLLAERRLAVIRALAITTSGGVLHVRASAGVGSYADGMTGAELLERADTALYAAKRSGKDRVCASE